MVSQYLRKSIVEILEWPESSPDLNPIESLRIYMKIKVAEKQPFSAKELLTAVKSLGERNQHQVLCIPIKSMSSHLAAIMPKKGGHNKYYKQSSF